MTPPLAIVQARLNSYRLPRKMLLPLADRPLIYWAWHAAKTAFDNQHTVVAIPATEENDELDDVVTKFGGRTFRWDGPENDVLGRFHACAHTYRWHPDSVIVRVTPDDPWKSVGMMRRVANGERLPVELGGEAFTLAQLDRAHVRWSEITSEREHISYAVFDTAPPPAPPGIWTIDTEADYVAAQKLVESAWGTVDLANLKGADA